MAKADGQSRWPMTLLLLARRFGRQGPLGHGQQLCHDAQRHAIGRAAHRDGNAAVGLDGNGGAPHESNSYSSCLAPSLSQRLCILAGIFASAGIVSTAATTTVIVATAVVLATQRVLSHRLHTCPGRRRHCQHVIHRPPPYPRPAASHKQPCVRRSGAAGAQDATRVGTPRAGIACVGRGGMGAIEVMAAVAQAQAPPCVAARNTSARNNVALAVALSTALGAAVAKSLKEADEHMRVVGSVRHLGLA